MASRTGLAALRKNSQAEPVEFSESYGIQEIVWLTTKTTPLRGGAGFPDTQRFDFSLEPLALIGR